MTESLQKKAFWGVIWGGMESLSTRLISFVVGIFLARILSPTDYGLIGMLALFTAIAQTLVESGMGNALVRKENRTEKDFSTVFYFNIVVSLTLYTLLYFSAPWIASFLKEPQLILLTRVLSLPLLINALCIVQQTRLTIELNFKRQSVFTIIASICGSLVGLATAFTGHGVWALVYSMLTVSVCRCLLLWIWGRWQPTWIFSWTSFRDLFAFSSKLVASGLLDTAYNNIRPLIIGKLYSGAELGYYSRAENYASLPALTVTGLIGRVTYPVLCTMQSDDVKLAQSYRRLIRLAAYIVFPTLLGIAAIAHPLVSVMITDKWLPCVPLLQILCCQLMWYPIHALNLNLLQVKGRSDLFLRLEIIKKVLFTLILIITIPISVKAMCYGSLLISLICLGINTYYTGQLIKVGFFKQMKDLLPTLLLSIGMAFFVWGGIHFSSSNLLSLLLGIPLGAGFYLILSRLLRMNELTYLSNLIKNQLFRKNVA